MGPLILIARTKHTAGIHSIGMVSVAPSALDCSSIPQPMRHVPCAMFLRECGPIKSVRRPPRRSRQPWRPIPLLMMHMHENIHVNVHRSVHVDMGWNDEMHKTIRKKKDVFGSMGMGMGV